MKNSPRYTEADQPSRSEEQAIDTSKGGEGHKDGNNPGHYPEHSLTKQLQEQKHQWITSGQLV